MYKILTKLHTSTENIYALHTVKDEDGNMIEYEAETGIEAAQEALKLLGQIGYEDLRIVNDESYYLDLIYGQKPEDPEEKYTIQFIYPDGVACEPEIISNILYNSTVSATIAFSVAPLSFHLIVDGEDMSAGLPDWIVYNSINGTAGTITFEKVVANHTIEIVVDEVSA